MSQGESLSVRSHFCLAQLRASVGPVPVVAVASLGGFGGLAGSRLGACRGLSVPALRGADYYAILGIPKNAAQAFLLSHLPFRVWSRSLPGEYTVCTFWRLRLRSSVALIAQCLSRCGVSNSQTDSGIYQVSTS